jgi:hypothetical protein
MGVCVKAAWLEGLHRTDPGIGQGARASKDWKEILHMTDTNRPGEMTGKPLIESDRVEGTAVYGPSGNEIGSIKRLMIEKMSGKVAYAVMSFDTFLGMGGHEHTIPWNAFHYDTGLGGYRADISEEQLRGAPAFSQERDTDWSDRRREEELHDHYRAPYYWRDGLIA